MDNLFAADVGGCGRRCLREGGFILSTDCCGLAPVSTGPATLSFANQSMYKAVVNIQFNNNEMAKS